MRDSVSKAVSSPYFSSLNLLKRLWREDLCFYKKKIAIAFCFMAMGAATTALLAKLMEPVIDDVFKNENAAQLYHVVLWVFLSFTLRGIANYGESVTLNYIGQSTITRLQKKILERLVMADLSYFYHVKSGVLLARATHNIQLLKNMLNQVIVSLGKDTFTILGLVIVMFYQQPLLATIAFVIFPTAFYPIARLSKKLRRLSSTTQHETGMLTAFFGQMLQGIRLIKSYAMESYEVKKGNALIDSLLALSLKSGKMRSLSSPIMETLGGVAIVIVIGYGGYQVIEGESTAGAFFSFITALLMAYEPIKRLANLHTSMQEGLSATEQIYEILDTRPCIKDAPQADIVPFEKGALSFENVSFAYAPQRLVLDHVTFHIQAGKTIAFVGPSGAGKSTLFNLILRFFDVTEGTIKIDEKPIQEYTLDALRRSIALVTQDIVLFDDTIYNNIAYGNPKASKEAILEAAREAAAHEFIEKLSDGYETLVGESGLKLSGGQRQRIALARAFLKKAPLLLLDEATAALDAHSEQLIQEALHRMKHRCTCLIIAHRLSTVKDADEIFVLDHGRILEHGSHEELTQKQGLYAYLSKIQFDIQ